MACTNRFITTRTLQGIGHPPTRQDEAMCKAKRRDQNAQFDIHLVEVQLHLSSMLGMGCLFNESNEHLCPYHNRQ
jgi:hypothetical protein